MTVRIVIADDHTVVRTGIKTELSNQPDFELTGEATNGDEALKLVNSTKPDILLIDLQMNGMSAKEVITTLKNRQAKTKVLVLSAYKERPIVSGVMKAGADGYLLKDDDEITISTAIRKLVSGQRYVSQSILDIMLDELRDPIQESTPSMFTDREIEIIKLIADGYSVNDVAQKAGMAKRTVEMHITNIYKKMGVSTHAMITKWAMTHGIL